MSCSTKWHDNPVIPCPHCGAGCEFDGTGCQTGASLSLSHYCMSEQAEIVVMCPCADWSAKWYYADDGYLYCDNCTRQYPFNEILRLVNQWGEALTAFGQRVQAAQARGVAVAR